MNHIEKLQEFRSRSHWPNKNLQFNTNFTKTSISLEDESSERKLSLLFGNLEEAVTFSKSKIIAENSLEFIRQDMREMLIEENLSESKPFYLTLSAIEY